MNKFDKRLSRQLWAQYVLALLGWARASAAEISSSRYFMGREIKK